MRLQTQDLELWSQRFVIKKTDGQRCTKRKSTVEDFTKHSPRPFEVPILLAVNAAKEAGRVGSG